MPGNMTVSLRINADGSAAITSLKQVEGAVGSLGQKGKASSAGIESLTSSLKSLAVTAGAALGVSALAASFLAANKEAGLLRASLVTVTGSVENATAAWESLQQFAAQTPFSLSQAVESFVKLKAMGLDPSIAALRSYGNTAGAMGKSLNQMVEAVADAGTGEFERLKEFGIKAKQNGDTVTLTFQGVTTTIGNNAKEIEAYLLKIGNVQFAGGMDRQAQTIAGSLSNLGDSWDQFWVKIGDTGVTAELAAVITDLGNGIGNLGNYLTGADGQANAFTTTMASMGEAIASTYWELKTGVWSDTTTAIMATVGAIGGWIAISTTLSVAIGTVTTAFGLLTAVMAANPFTLMVAAIGATAGVLYALSDQTVIVGDTVTTVGSLVQATWETTADYARAAWDNFSSYVGGMFNALPPVVSTVASGIISIWTSLMQGLQDMTGGAVNFIANAFGIVGRSIGVIAGEISIAGFAGKIDFSRLSEGLSDAAQTTDYVGEASKRAAEGVKKFKTEVVSKSGAIAEDALETKLSAVVTSEHAKQDREAANAARMAAISHIKTADGAKAAGAAHKGASGAANQYSSDLKRIVDQFLPARAESENMEKAVATLDQALAKGDITAAEYAQAIAKIKDAYEGTGSAAQRLIDEYDREGAQTRKLASDRAELNRIIEEGGSKAEGAAVALKQLDAQEKSNIATSDVWGEMWKNAVKRIDDAFAGLWENLITGTGSTLDNLKSMLGKWLAEVAHALLTKPLVVALTTSMTGTAGAAGTATGAVSQASSGLGGLSNITSLFSTAWSLGSTFLEGVAAGFSSMFSGTAGTALSFAWAGATSGTASGMAAGLGVAMPYIAPLLAIAGVAISKFFADQEPRYGAWSATVGNNPRGLEDWENGPDNYARGGFGLTFGLSDNGSKNMDASEMKDQFNAFAQITQMLADFFGKSLSAKIQAGLESAAFANWTQDGVMRLANNEDMASAFKGIIDMIADQAAVTGEHIGVAFEYALGDLTGTAEEMATQVQVAMQAAAAYTLVAEAWNTHIGAALGLTGDFGADIRTLGGYVAAFANDGENAAQTLARLSVEIGALEYAASITSTTLDGLVGTDLITLAEQLADAFGSADVANQALAFYAEQFQSTQEILKRHIDAAIEQIQRTWDSFDFEKLMPVIPQTRAEFEALVNSIDLTTEAGRAFFAMLMTLAPAFDQIFDAQESFQNWIDPQDPVIAATDRVRDLFSKWGLQMPKTREELEAMYRAGQLTAEQMAELGIHLDDLRLIFGEVEEVIVDLTGLYIRLAQALGDDATALRLQREQELTSAANDAARALLLLIYATEDLGKSPNKYNYGIRDARDPRLTGGQYNTEILIALSKLIGANYKAFDNGSGGIKGDELRGLLKDIAGPDEIDKLIAALDKNGDGTIGELERLPLLIAANISPLFDQFDTNKSGGLDFEELKKVLGGTLDDEQLKAMFELLDINGDGLIDKTEAANIQQIAAINGQRDAVVGKLDDVVGAVNDAATRIIGALGILGDRLLGANTKEVSVKSALNSEAIITANDDDGIISAQGVASASQVDAIGISTTGIINAINQLGIKFPGINIDKSALLPPPNLIRDEAGDSASLRAALADLQSEIAALRAGTEKAAQANERGSTALQGAAEKLHNAATAIPERLEVVVPSLYSEAGF